MMIDREALREKVARAIYEADDPWHTVWPWPDLKDGGADKLREIADAVLAALDQPAQEPLAWMYHKPGGSPYVSWQPPDEVKWPYGVTPLYAAPQPATLPTESR